MNIIEAIQQAEGGKLIRNGMLKRIDHFLKYMGGGVFYEYELISGKDLTSSKKYKYEVREFSVGYILSNDWEVFDGDSLF
jgi:hypothetical protein